MIGEETMGLSRRKQCPGYGGIFLDMASCPDCPVPLRLEDIISGTLIRNKIDRERAMDAIRSLLFYKHVSRTTGFRYDFPECSLRYVPFWRFRAYVSGHADGYIDEGGETVTLAPARRSFSQTLTWTTIADDTVNVGVRYLRNRGGEETPYDASPGPTANITISREDAMAEGSKAMETYAIRQLKKENLYRCKMSDIELSHLEMTRVFYPLWVVKYSYSKLVFEATVDGVTGELLSGGKVDDLLARCAVAGMLAGIFIAPVDVLFFANGWVGYALLILITGLGYGIIADVLAYIRYGRAIAGDRPEGLFKFPRKTKRKRNGLAMLGVATGFGLMAFSIFGWGTAFITFYLLANQGLAIYLFSSLFLYDMSDRIIGNVQEAR